MSVSCMYGRLCFLCLHFSCRISVFNRLLERSHTRIYESTAQSSNSNSDVRDDDYYDDQRFDKSEKNEPICLRNHILAFAYTRTPTHTIHTLNRTKNKFETSEILAMPFGQFAVVHQTKSSYSRCVSLAGNCER